MAGNWITSLFSLATNLLPYITASAQAPSSSSSNSNDSQKERAQAVEGELERLMLTLEWIKATLYDAEKREITDGSVKLWLKKLKKVASDAEDVLSRYQYEVRRVQVEARNASEASGSHKRKQIEYIVPIPDGMVDRLHEIRSRFDEIAKHRKALRLRKSDGERRPNNKFSRPPTGHMVDEESIFGRAAEIKDVTNCILSEKEKSFSVISIVGKGGLGKTTIAQLVYKDLKKSQCFDLFGWVCVYEEFDVKRLTKATIESFSKPKCGVSELSPLQAELEETVKGKTMLLVLDDVWNEDRSVWELFQLPFKEAKMVRILVTTRNEKVADIMQTTTYSRPTYLPEDSSWQLFQHYAFSGTSDTMPIQFVDMGKVITRRCGGLPLAVKTISRLLKHEADEEVWREILESGLWENKESKQEIFPALQISYAHLPAHLKPCFLFCSMYPKDYEFRKMDLIRLWIAHGYIESRSNRKITEIGVEYWNELRERSFLDDAYTDSKEYCKLHDIIHDLARHISENEHYSVETNEQLDIQQRTIPREVYHLYVGGSMGLGYANQIPQENMKGLRTIIINMGGWVEHFDPNLELMDDCQDCSEGVTLCNLTQFEVLRVLILEWGSLTKIPHSISELKHLTYLSIRSSRLKMLPSSICCLYNLLSLVLICTYFEYLPENIGDLANLRLLYVHSDTGLKKLPNSLCLLTNLVELSIGRYGFLDYVPHGLVNFPSITKFSARLKVRSIGWLKDMDGLEGRISIGGLENINNLEDAKRANLRNKCKLEMLELCWHDRFHDYIFYSNNSSLVVDIIPEACEGGIVGLDGLRFSMLECHQPHLQKHLSLLECLQPHPNLKKLGVKGYPSAIVPGWMRDPLLLKSIQELRLENCIYIESFPFGNFHALKYLEIVACSSIPTMQLTSQLESLSFCNLHTLKHLDITSCSGIRTMQLELLPSQLEILVIRTCGCLELITGLGHLDMLKRLEILCCYSLKSLTMGGLQLVESTEPFSDFSHEIPHINRQSISSLTQLVIQLCHSLHSLPDGLIPSGPCDVTIYSCGCPDYYKSIKESLSSHDSDADETEDDESDDSDEDDERSHDSDEDEREDAIEGTSSSHHTSMSNIEDDVEDEGEDDDSDEDKSN